MQRIPKERGWIQTYIMTRMLVRPVNLSFWKSGESGLFCLKNREILLKLGHFIIPKEIGIQATFRLFKSVLSSTKVFLGASGLLST